MLALPVLVLVAVGVLAGLNLNGSSVALNSRLADTDPNIVAGTPRVVRGDEFALATPVQIGNARRDFPAHAWIGLTDTDMDVAGQAAPVLSLTTAFQPVNFPYFVLGVERAFAARWWLVVAVGLLGTYALLLALRRKPLLAAAMAAVVGLGPIVAWWSNGPALTIGYLAAATAALLVALRVRSPWAATSLGVVVAYFACTAFFVLYPPWLLSVGLVMAAVVVGDVVARRPSVLRVMLVAVSALVPTVAVLGLWAHQSSVALAATAGTIYPGNRVSGSGEGHASVLVGSALNTVLSDDPTALALDPGAPVQLNQSEVSAPWFSLPVLLIVLILVIVVLVRTIRGRRTTDHALAAGTADAAAAAPPAGDSMRSWAPFLAVTVVLVVELLWMLAPVPDLVGRITLLDRVPGPRMTLALGVGAALLVYLAAGRVRIRRTWLVVLLTVLAAAGAAALTWWSATQLLNPGTQGVGRAAVAGAVVAGCLTVLCLGRVTWPAAVLLVAVVLYNFVIVNPLYRGLGPLTHGPLANAVAAIEHQDGPTRWIDTAGVGSASVVAASGNELVTGMTVYPTRSVWERLAPAQEAEWNNFAKYIWVNDPTEKPAQILPVRGSLHRLRIDVCNPDVAFLDIRYAVTSATTVPACFVAVATVHDLGTTVVISRRR